MGLTRDALPWCLPCRRHARRLQQVSCSHAQHALPPTHVQANHLSAKNIGAESLIDGTDIPTLLEGEGPLVVRQGRLSARRSCSRLALLSSAGLCCCLR